MNFSAKVKETLEEKNMNNTELARLIGFSPQYTRDLIVGNRRWNEEAINKVCNALNLKVEFILLEDEKNETNSQI